MFAGIKLLSYLYCYFIHKQLILGKFSKKNPVVLAWIFVKSSILYVRLGSEYASCIITNIVDLEHDFAWRATTVTPTSSYLCWGRLIIVSFPRRFIVTPFTRAMSEWIISSERHYLANIYQFKVNNRNNKGCEISSKLTIKKTKQRQWRRFGVFVVKFEHISNFFKCFYCWLWTSKCLLGLSFCRTFTAISFINN